VNPTKFFGELKRRNVYKVAIAYAVIAWLLIQAGSILFPTFEAPSWVMKAFVTVVTAGFPAALIFSWAFEITPEGIVRETEVEASRSITHHTGRKIVGADNRRCSDRRRFIRLSSASRKIDILIRGDRHS
jgi:hypothetical protein